MLREIFAFLGFQLEPSGFIHAAKATDQIKAKAVAATDSFAGLGQGLQGFIALLAEGAIIGFANHIAEEAFEVGKLAAQLGMSTKELQAWELGAKRVGVTTTDLSIAFRRLSIDLAGGTGGTGSKQAQAVFRRLGVDMQDGQKKARTLGDIMPEIAEKFKGLTNETEKVAIAQQLFGKSGERLLPLLNQGKEGIAQLTEEFDKLGGGFSPQTIKNAEAYIYSLAKLNTAFTGIKDLLGLSFLPKLTQAVDLLTEGTVALKNFAAETTGVSSLVEMLAAVLAFQLANALEPYLGTGLKFAAIYLAVDDLLAFLDGKDSVIGDLLNRAFGDGTATQVRQWVNDAKDSFGGWLAAFKVVVPDIYNAMAVQFDKAKLSWDEMILGFEDGWNEFVAKLHLPDGLKFDKAVFDRRNDIEKDKSAVSAAEEAKRKSGEAVANYAAASTALSGQGAAPATGPLRAPVVTQNFVEVKPNISITIPPGTSQAHAQRLVREAAEGVVSTQRRAAAQALEQKGGA